MHQPRPHGLGVVGGALTDEDSAAVELLARRLTNLKTLSGVESMRMVRALPDGGYVIAQDMGGIFKAITHKPESRKEEFEHDGVASDNIPMLFSGVVTKAVLRGNEGLGMKLTEQARKRIASYGDKLPAKDVRLQRFRIDYNSMVQELAPQAATVVFYSQYAQQRPSWYSGAMAEVMQIVGGYGRQELGKLPDDPLEQATMKVPAKYMREIRKELGNVRLPGYTGFPDKSGEFQYDYKFNNTNGVTFDSAGKPWLTRVSPTGVHVMPLPLVPATTIKAFREYIEESKDDEILAILDRFGGLPSGESFPVDIKEFEAWRRAGVIIKVCDTADFYDHIMYSSACGWTFNTRGTEGYNTCYDYYDDEGLGYGLTYKIKLVLGAAENGGKLPQSFDLEDEQQARMLDEYLSSIYRLMTNSAEHRAIKYKIRRVDVGDILARYGNAPASELEYWGRLELEPIASHGGSVVEVGRGYLYHPAKFEFQPQIKFPEPFMGGCVSHDFLPLINGRYKESYPNCDTIMFCYYVGDDLKVVKYFREERSFDREIENDYEPCMTVGSWAQTVTEGSSAPVGNFYTTDIDERKVLAPVIETTKIIGRDLGFDHTPFFSFQDFFSRCGSLWRNRYYSHHTTVERTEGNQLEVAVCIPYLSRNALIHAKKEGTSGGMVRESAALGSVRDPHSYRYFTYDFILAWVGCDAVDSGVSPSPNDGSPVWVTRYEYSPSACSDFADQGPWIEALPQDYTWLVWPARGIYQFNGGGGPPAFKSYSIVTQGERTESGDLHISIRDGVDMIHNKVPDNRYFIGSPTELGDVFYRDACKIEFGESVYASVSEADGSSPRKFWGFTNLADHKSAHHFFGVINE